MYPKEEEKKISCFEELDILFKKLEAFPVKPMSFFREIYSFYYFTKIAIFFLAADEQIVKKKLCMLCPVLFFRYVVHLFHNFMFLPVFRIRMFLGLPDPDPLVRGPDPDPSIIKQK